MHRSPHALAGVLSLAIALASTVSMMPSTAVAYPSSDQIQTRGLELSDAEVRAFHAAVDAENASEIMTAARLKPGLLDSHHREDGFTPLIRAARLNKARTVKLLLSLGADPMQQETKVMNAIGAHKAAFWGHEDVIDVFLTSLPDATLRRMLEIQGPKNGKTVLMDAMWLSRPTLPPEAQIKPERIPAYVRICLKLIDASRRVGADLNLRDHDGRSALDTAKLYSAQYPQFQQVVRALRGR